MPWWAERVNKVSKHELADKSINWRNNCYRISSLRNIKHRTLGSIPEFLPIFLL
jgi:hypothetical protein